MKNNANIAENANTLTTFQKNSPFFKPVMCLISAKEGTKNDETAKINETAPRPTKTQENAFQYLPIKNASSGIDK